MNAVGAEGAIRAARDGDEVVVDGIGDSPCRGRSLRSARGRANFSLHLGNIGLVGPPPSRVAAHIQARHRCRAWDSSAHQAVLWLRAFAMGEIDDATRAYLDDVAGALARGVPEHIHTATALRPALYDTRRRRRHVPRDTVHLRVPRTHQRTLEIRFAHRAPRLVGRSARYCRPEQSRQASGRQRTVRTISSPGQASSCR